MLHKISSEIKHIAAMDEKHDGVVETNYNQDAILTKVRMYLAILNGKIIDAKEDLFLEQIKPCLSDPTDYSLFEEMADAFFDDFPEELLYLKQHIWEEIEVILGYVFYFGSEIKRFDEFAVIIINYFADVFFNPKKIATLNFDEDLKKFMELAEEFILNKSLRHVFLSKLKNYFETHLTKKLCDVKQSILGWYGKFIKIANDHVECHREKQKVIHAINQFFNVEIVKLFHELKERRTKGYCYGLAVAFVLQDEWICSMARKIVDCCDDELFDMRDEIEAFYKAIDKRQRAFKYAAENKADVPIIPRQIERHFNLPKIHSEISTFNRDDFSRLMRWFQENGQVICISSFVEKHKHCMMIDRKGSVMRIFDANYKDFLPRTFSDKDFDLIFEELKQRFYLVFKLPVPNTLKLAIDVVRLAGVQAKASTLFGGKENKMDFEYSSKMDLSL